MNQPSIVLRNAGTLLAAVLVAGACKHTEAPTTTAVEASPNATIVPQPLLTGTGWVATKTPAAPPGASASTTAAGKKERPPPPTPLPFDLESPPQGRQKAAKAAVPLLIRAEFAWPEVPTRGHFFGLRGEALTQAQAEGRRTLTVDLRSHDRIVITLETDAFPLPKGTTIEARADYLGFILGFPESPRRRLLSQGVMRALFGEGRADASPLLSAIVKTAATGRVLGVPTELSRLTTQYAAVTLEQATFADLGFGGTLLCRFLLEFAGVAPLSPACTMDQVPLAADFVVEGGGRLRFQVLSLDAKSDHTAPLPLVPPPDVVWEETTLPRQVAGALSAATRRALRPGGEGAKAFALKVRNHETRAAYILLNHVPAVVVAPQATAVIRDLQGGNYEVQKLDFFGRRMADTEVLEVPAVVHLGALPPDAGVLPSAQKP